MFHTFLTCLSVVQLLCEKAQISLATHHTKVASGEESTLETLLLLDGLFLRRKVKNLLSDHDDVTKFFSRGLSRLC